MQIGKVIFLTKNVDGNDQARYLSFTDSREPRVVRCDVCNETSWCTNVSKGNLRGYYQYRGYMTLCRSCMITNTATCQQFPCKESVSRIEGPPELLFMREFCWEHAIHHYKIRRLAKTL